MTMITSPGYMTDSLMVLSSGSGSIRRFVTSSKNWSSSSLEKPPSRRVRAEKTPITRSPIFTGTPSQAR